MMVVVERAGLGRERASCWGSSFRSKIRFYYTCKRDKKINFSIDTCRISILDAYRPVHVGLSAKGVGGEIHSEPIRPGRQGRFATS